MTNTMDAADTVQARWARFRFSIIGPLLSSPPGSGELQSRLAELAIKEWCHPINSEPVSFSLSTLERWFYKAKKNRDPVAVLRSKRRCDADKSRTMNVALKQVLQAQYREHPSWSYQLHHDNLKIRVKASPELEIMPSYQTIMRYMKANGFCKQRNIRRFHTAGAEKAADRLEQREVRSFEVDYVHGLWHLDFHHGSRKILGKNGKWHKPLLLAILDDHSRLVCHSQWYLDETVETLVHGFMQALQKRGLPRALMSDNGSAMIAAEFYQGLERLGIVHQLTLPYSPYQNAKQEVFWAQVEGRLMAMLENEVELTLPLLNEATIAWIEFEYHRKLHSELGATPLERYLKQDKNVGRSCPDTAILKSAFCAEVKRKQRKSDGTFTLEGCRFEVPSAYKHLQVLSVRYARWDLSHALLIDPHSNACLTTLYPQDKSANADGRRRMLNQENTPRSIDTDIKASGIAPLLKALIAEYAATGMPPAYLPSHKEREIEEEKS